MWIADGWEDYELLDCGGGEKLERWGDQILVRPDPQAIWESDHLIGVLPGVHVHNGALLDGVLQPLHVVTGTVVLLDGQCRNTQRYRQDYRQAQRQCPPAEPVYKGVFFHIFPPE